MPDKYRRYFLRAKDAGVLVDEAWKRLGVDLRQMFGADVEVVEAGFADVFLMNGRAVLARVEGEIFPTLVSGELLASAPKLVVDMGAVPHVCNGADVMAPGVRRYDGDFKKGDFVIVVDERHGKPIALGEAVYDSDDMRRVKHGVVVRAVHFVGDKTWNLIKQLEAKT